MPDFACDLASRLEQLRSSGLYRQLRRVDTAQACSIISRGRSLLNFSSNDYLGFANHDSLKQAARIAVEKFGAGAGSSRLICGSLAPHEELETALAQFKGTEAALSFSTGYAAALGTIGALVGTGDIVILDKLSHACLVDAARLSGATLRVFAHNNLEDLEKKLAWAQQQVASNPRNPRVLVVTESVFSMDGDPAPLAELVALKQRFGAWLMVDEAHSTGLYGPNRRGLAEALGVSDEIEIQMGTLGKALGASGGYIAGSQLLIDFLINKARSFIFSTAPVPAAAAAATAGVRLVQSPAGAILLTQLWARVAELRAALGLDFPTLPSAIIPLIVGDETRAVDLAARLVEQGFLIPAIRYPTVARGKARLRITLSASHTADQVANLANALTSLNMSVPNLNRNLNPPPP
jgi:8-amino-7-oxononanoate synthase